MDDQNPGNDNDVVYYMLASPSLPVSEFMLEGDCTGDDGFIDVDFAPGV